MFSGLLKDPELTLPAMSITFALLMVLFMVPLGLGIGVSARVGQQLGKGDHVAARYADRACVESEPKFTDSDSVSDSKLLWINLRVPYNQTSIVKTTSENRSIPTVYRGELGSKIPSRYGLRAL